MHLRAGAPLMVVATLRRGGHRLLAKKPRRIRQTSSGSGDGVAINECATGVEPAADLSPHGTPADSCWDAIAALAGRRLRRSVQLRAASYQATLTEKLHQPCCALLRLAGRFRRAHGWASSLVCQQLGATPIASSGLQLGRAAAAGQ